MFTIVIKLAPTMYVYSQFNSKHGISVQIKPDQIKSKRRSLGLKYNRPGARTGYILNIDSDKSPNLSEVIKECLGSNQTRPDQIQLGSIGKTKVYVDTSKYQSINVINQPGYISFHSKVQPARKKNKYITKVGSLSSPHHHQPQVPRFLPYWEYIQRQRVSKLSHLDKDW